MKSKLGTSGKRQLRVTATDVAKLAGVSQMTVSRVINNDSQVREKTRAKVESAINQLGYEPNKAARSLVNANPISIGLLYSNPNSTFLSKMMIGVLDRARQSDTNVMIVTCDEGPDAVGIVNGLIEDGIDGILLAPPLCDSKSLFKVLIENDIPAVTVGSHHDEQRISAVFMDDRKAAFTMTRHLLSLGHRRIAFIVGEPDQAASQLRQAGFTEAMASAGIPPDDYIVYQGEFSFHSGFDAAETLLQGPEMPTAILASNDDMAAGAISAARECGFRVPEDVSVCGFDDSVMATEFWPPITTIHQPIDRMTQAAIEHLENSIRRKRAGSKRKARHMELDFSLVKRDSDTIAPGAKMEAVSNRTGNIAHKYSSASSRKPTVM